jgi:transposase
MRRADVCLYLNPSDRAKLEAIMANRSSPSKWVWRADIVLATAEGLGTNAIMQRTGMSKPCVWRWQERYMDEGVPGLLRDKTRPSRIAPLPAEKKLAIIQKTATEKPANATHWSARKMAKAVGVSHRSVQRVWAGAGLKPHLVRTFKLSNDPQFAEKVVDVVGLYMNPPERALVLCVDEKSQIQALDRTQPGLPIKKGRAQTMTHDYKRNGTTTLFAALDVKTGQVIGQCLPRHRAKEFIKFLNKIDTAVDKALDLHLILDNYSTHKTKQVRKLVEACTPASSCTSFRPRRLGSIWSNGSSPRLPRMPSAAELSRVSTTSRPSSPTILQATTMPRRPSYGPSPPMSS